MKEFVYTIREELGMHARPAAGFVKGARAFPCRITIIKNQNHEEADAKQIIAVMGLELGRGDEITLKAEGEQEAEAVMALGRFLEENL